MSTTHHEATDIEIQYLWRIGLGLTVSGIVVLLAVWLVFRVLSTREAARASLGDRPELRQQDRLPPEPRLQSDPRQDLAIFRAQEDGLLTSYGWVDRNAGIVRIPIDQAMQLIVDRGLPSREGTNAPR